MANHLLTFAKQLIAIRSTADNPKATRQALQLCLSMLKNDFTVEWFEDHGVPSVLVHNRKKGHRRFDMILNGHLDVVPGKEEQYSPRVVGDRLYGCGSMDMKANVTCLVTVFDELAKQVDYALALQLVGDEEVGGFHGTKHQVDCGVRAGFVLAGEPTNFDIVYKAKGILKATVSAQGVSAHGAYPWRGKNAIWSMHDMLTSLRKAFPIPKKEVWETTLNLARIETTNTWFNKIPDDCTASVDIRFVAEEKKLALQRLKSVLSKDMRLTVLAQEPALDTDRKDPSVVALSKAAKQVTKKRIVLRGANGTSDARHFARVGGSGVEFGPIGGDIGGPKEWVSISSLDTYCEILRAFLLAQ